MSTPLRSAKLVGIGAVAGIALSLGLTAVAERTPGDINRLPVDEIREFSEIFGTIKSFYVEPVQDKKLFADAINGMLTGLDPHSAYLDENAYGELRANTQGQFGGLGIEIGTEDGFVKVITPIEDTPAAKAGIKAGDLIVKIDNTPTKGLQLEQAVKMMRGKPKTRVTLTLQRKGAPQPIVVTVVRDIIRVKSVRSKLLEPGVGYFRVSQFQEHTVDSLVDQIVRMGKTSGPLDSIILDLRNDPGGLLNGAIGVSAIFLKPGMEVVSTDGRTADAKRSFNATPEDYLMHNSIDPLRKLPAWVKTAKMVVLVNAGSASASEIVAGALQDHKRATIIGTQTFGKGSVQTILPINITGNNTAIKLTTARYYTPNGRSIQARGILPDHTVEESADAEINNFRIREADLQRHLSNDRDSTPEVKSNAPSNIDQQRLRDYKPVELGVPENDFQLQQALNFLKGKPVVKMPPAPVAANDAKGAADAKAGKAANDAKGAADAKGGAARDKANGSKP